jgi:hypothetical protein
MVVTRMATIIRLVETQAMTGGMVLIRVLCAVVAVVESGHMAQILLAQIPHHSLALIPMLEHSTSSTGAA